MVLVFIVITFSACSTSTSSNINGGELKNLKSSVFDIEVGTTKLVKFTVESEKSNLDVQIYQTEDETPLGTFNDSGIDGDDIANDGIYSVSLELTQDNRCNIEYYASNGKSKSNGFEICYFKDISEQEYNNYRKLSKTIENFNTYEEALSYIENSKEITEFVADKNTEVISYTSNYGISGMWAEFSEDMKFNSTQNNTQNADIPYQESYYDEAQNQLNNMQVGSYSSKKSVLVVRPYRSTDFQYDNFMRAGRLLASASSGAIDIRDDGDADIETFKSFGNYGTVLVDSHGTLNKEKPYMVTGETLNNDNFSDYSADLNGNRIVTVNNRLCVSASFFGKYYPTNSLDDTSLFLGTCFSAYDNSFGNVFMHKGAPLVLGYSNAVSVRYCNATLYQFMVRNMLLSGAKATDAFNDTLNVCGKQDSNGTELVMFVKENPFTLYDINNTARSGKISLFSIIDKLNMNLGDCDVIEPNIEFDGDTDYIIHWSSSNNQVVSVCSEGKFGIINAVGAGDAVINATIVCGSDTIEASTEIHVSKISRDVVLVLDCSGSMEGDPFYEMQKVAKSFCSDIISNYGDNRVAIVAYDSDIYSTGLTSDYDELENYINSLYTGSRTNLYSAIERAGDILDAVGDSQSIKNIVVMTDGLPNEGQVSSSGSFSNANYYGYGAEEYANAVVDKANDLMINYNMYSLGFFHSLYGEEYDFGTSLVSKLTNQQNGSYEVDEAENLRFAFGDIGETITDGSKIIINIACPVDVSVSYNGETLSSNSGEEVQDCSFGTVKLLGKDRDIKLFELDPSNVYDVKFDGTGDGTMDYSINYYDEDNNLIDYRNFASIPLSDTTVMDSSTDNSKTVALKIDSDGDGNYNDVWEADESSSGSSVTKKTENVTVYRGTKTGEASWIIIMICVTVLFTVIFVIIAIVKSTKKTPTNQANNQKPNSEIGNKQKMRIPSDPSNPPTKPLGYVNNGFNSHRLQLSAPNHQPVLVDVDNNKTYKVGKDPAWADIVVPAQYKKISRRHCEIKFDANSNCYIVKDLSTNGIYTNEGKKFANGVTKLNVGSVVYLADTNCKILLN